MMMLDRQGRPTVGIDPLAAPSRPVTRAHRLSLGEAGVHQRLQPVSIPATIMDADKFIRLHASHSGALTGARW